MQKWVKAISSARVAADIDRTKCLHRRDARCFVIGSSQGCRKTIRRFPAQLATQEKSPEPVFGPAVLKHVAKGPGPIVIYARKAEAQCVGRGRADKSAHRGLAICGLLKSRVGGEVFRRIASHEVDDAACGVATGERGLWARKHLDPLNIGQFTRQGGECRLRNVVNDDASLRLNT